MEKKFNKIRVVCTILICLGTVSLVVYFDNQWFNLFYSTILALFIQELKEFILYFPKRNQIRISYAYIFRIEVEGNYFLVKNEQGRNNYHPVGGVYKYNPDSIDIAEQFGGVYDNIFNATDDTDNDLRLFINRRKFRNFHKWFLSQNERENLEDLSREFREELIEREIVSKENFREVKYTYVGSYDEKSKREDLSMRQRRHFDVFCIKLSSEQKKELKQLMGKTSDQYVFAHKENIETGKIKFAGRNYEIPEYTQLILINTSKKLKRDFDSQKTYEFYL